jgi:hypothetical protein
MLTSGATWATAEHGTHGIHAGGFNAPCAARRIDKLGGTLWTDIMLPPAALLDETADNHGICIGKQPRHTLIGGAASSKYWELGGAANGVEFTFINGCAGFGSGDNHAVSKKELSGARACGNVNIAGNGVRGMLLLDVCKDLDAICTD